MYVHISRYPFGPNHLLLTIDIQIFYLRLFFLLHSKKIIDNHGRQFLLITNTITQQMIMDFFCTKLFSFLFKACLCLFFLPEKNIFFLHTSSMYVYVYSSKCQGLCSMKSSWENFLLSYFLKDYLDFLFKNCVTF